jgi:hypothetical protein
VSKPVKMDNEGAIGGFFDNLTSHRESEIAQEVRISIDAKIEETSGGIQDYKKTLGRQSDPLCVSDYDGGSQISSCVGSMALDKHKFLKQVQDKD